MEANHGLVKAMEDHSILIASVVFLIAAVGSVALFRVLKLSPVLGYLLAGVLIGPFGFQIIAPTLSTSHFAEFGVIFLMFMIGLELSVDRLKTMRRHVFEFGSLQVLITALLIGCIGYYFGLTWQQAVIVGGALALSSTAIVLQVLAESGQKFSQVGRLSLAALILQDLAVIPLLVLLQVYSSASANENAALALGEASLTAVAAVIVMLGGGRLLFRPLFRFIASLGDTELVTAATLLIVIGAALASAYAGLSPAMGAFLAGLLVAETEFKHQVEADIMPYKGILLGLFFITVGMTLDWRLLIEKFALIAQLVLALIVLKTLVIFMLSRLYGFNKGASIHAGLLLSQGGEFAFVVFGLAIASGFLGAEIGAVLLVVVTVTMALTPLLAELGRHACVHISGQSHLSIRHAHQDSQDMSNHVVICGFGRVGHTVARLLETEGVDHVALDTNPEIVMKERAKGNAVHYGDGSRKLVMKAVGVEHARAVIITHSDPAIAGKTIMAVRALRQDVPIIVRAKNLQQVEWLERLGANIAIAEMFETSLQLGGALLKEIGVDDAEITRVVQSFREGDYALTREAEGSEGGE
jgi:CPA2 family monovalent cation:H+ antiporter-2